MDDNVRLTHTHTSCKCGAKIINLKWTINAVDNIGNHWNNLCSFSIHTHTHTHTHANWMLFSPTRATLCNMHTWGRHRQTVLAHADSYIQCSLVPKHALICSVKTATTDLVQQTNLYGFVVAQRRLREHKEPLLPVLHLRKYCTQKNHTVTAITVEDYTVKCRQVWTSLVPILPVPASQLPTIWNYFTVTTSDQ